MGANILTWPSGGIPSGTSSGGLVLGTASSNFPASIYYPVADTIAGSVTTNNTNQFVSTAATGFGGRVTCSVLYYSSNYTLSPFLNMTIATVPFQITPGVMAVWDSALSSFHTLGITLPASGLLMLVATVPVSGLSVSFGLRRLDTGEWIQTSGAWGSTFAYGITYTLSNVSCVADGAITIYGGQNGGTLQISSIRWMQTGTPTIIPTSATVVGSATQSFDFSGFDGALVSWSDTLGTVTPVGLYTAPAATGSTQTDHAVVSGLGNTGQSASATITIPPISAPATAFTLTGPSSGYMSNVSTNFTFTPNNTYTGTITPTMTGLAGTWAPTSLTWSGPGIAKTATFTPSATGSGTANGTASPTLTVPASVAYTSNPRTLVVSPTSVMTGATGLTLNLTGGGTAWTPGTPGSPVFTVSAGTKTAQTVTSATVASITYSAPGSPQTVSITDPGTSATAILSVDDIYSVLAVAPYGAAYTGLTLGYTIYNPDGTVFQAHTTVGVVEITGMGIYQVELSVPRSYIGLVVWDAPIGIDPYVREIQPPLITSGGTVYYAF